MINGIIAFLLCNNIPGENSAKTRFKVMDEILKICIIFENTIQAAFERSDTTLNMTNMLGEIEERRLFLQETHGDLIHKLRTL